MSLENFIRIQRKAAAFVRTSRSGDPRNAGMDEYVNSQYAAGMEAVLTDLEEYIRQSERVHQDRT